MSFIAVHCGSAHVKGKARTYRYFIASRFEIHRTRDGHLIYRNAGKLAGPFRSFDKTLREASTLADADDIVLDSYGSLHNRPVRPDC